MTPEQILAIAPKVLTQQQREFYFNEGYLCVERAIDAVAQVMASVHPVPQA